ncbi:hypothetical protein J7I97_20455 [Streptomyces sp. ISL-87]|uniref:hypothetical protein n=1 Tax=Streptomyces sp. ISL-87 TaxID=2819188 RepID=UPI001BED2A54|nr:hypothetical protein [Streptomyces sp. ISL-87]MBT2610575.1 hypothetical protein [Streptomyces sp. ISL-87]
MSYFPTSANRSADPLSLALRSAALMRSIARAAGEGAHRLLVVLVTLDGVDEVECTITGPVLDEETPGEAVVKTAALLARTATGGMAMVVLRTTGRDDTVAVMSWAVSDLTARPATAEQSHIAHCISENSDYTDPATGITFVDAPALI